MARLQRIGFHSARYEKFRAEQGASCLHNRGAVSRKQRDSRGVREDLQAGRCSCELPGECQGGSGAASGLDQGLQRDRSEQESEEEVPERG